MEEASALIGACKDKPARRWLLGLRRARVAAATEVWSTWSCGPPSRRDVGPQRPAHGDVSAALAGELDREPPDAPACAADQHALADHQAGDLERSQRSQTGGGSLAACALVTWSGIGARRAAALAPAIYQVPLDEVERQRCRRH